MFCLMTLTGLHIENNEMKHLVVYFTDLNKSLHTLRVIESHIVKVTKSNEKKIKIDIFISCTDLRIEVETPYLLTVRAVKMFCIGCYPDPS